MTYADASWNAPFYERRGFRVLDPLPPFLEPLAEVKRRLGLDRHGRRLGMRRELCPAAAAPLALLSGMGEAHRR